MKTSNYVNETLLSTPLNEPIVVVCAADDNYAMPMVVTIRSALENLDNSRKLLLCIMDGGITKRNKRRIVKSLSLKQCEIKWIPRPDVFDDKIILSDQLPSLKFLPNATFYKLLIPSLLPQFAKAIYLDCDLVVRESLEKLWNLDLEENYLLSPETKDVITVSHPNFGLLNWKELGFSADDKRLTAGVLVFNLEKWRTDNMCTKALEYLVHNHQYIRWHESDVLAAIVGRQWGVLDSRWNRVEARFLTDEEVKDSFILHFTSYSKPWIAIEKNPASELFFRYLAMTDWSGYRHTIPQRLWRRLKRETKSRLKKIRF